MTRPRRIALSLLAVTAVAALGGCTERGDFGRPRASVLAEAAPVLGTRAAALRGEPASGFVHTDDEVDLRRRAWRFLMPPEEADLPDAVVADAVRTRLLPRGAEPDGPDLYHDALMAGPFRSPASRYRRLGEDAAADAALAGPFAALADRVLRADRVRLAGLAGMSPRRAEEAADALDRVAENRCLIAQVRAAAHARARAYRIALGRLVIEAPQGEAVAAERALAGLDVAAHALDALPVPSGAEAACAGAPGPIGRPVARAVVAKG